MLTGMRVVSQRTGAEPDQAHPVKARVAGQHLHDLADRTGGMVIGQWNALFARPKAFHTMRRAAVYKTPQLVAVGDEMDAEIAAGAVHRRAEDAVIKQAGQQDRAQAERKPPGPLMTGVGEQQRHREDDRDAELARLDRHQPGRLNDQDQHRGDAAERGGPPQVGAAGAAHSGQAAQ